jgi:hypothetical protein
MGRLRDLQKGYTAQLRHHIATAYAIARGFEKNREAWRAFLTHDFWKQRTKRPKETDQSDCLLHVMVFVFGAISRARYQRASKYATALRWCWDFETPPEEIEVDIEKAGGIEELYRQSKNTRKKAKKKCMLSLLPKNDGLAARLRGLEEGCRARITISRLPGNRGAIAEILKIEPLPSRK